MIVPLLEYEIICAKYKKVLICFTLFKKTAKCFFGAIPPSIRTATGLESSCYFKFGEKKISREKRLQVARQIDSCFEYL